MAGEVCSKSVLVHLKAHLLAQVPELDDVLLEFPGVNIQLKYPSLAISILAPEFLPFTPYLLSQGSVANSQASVKRVTGAWEFRLQLDLWARDKFERFKLQEKLMDALNPNAEGPLGLNLELTTYHGVWCHYSLLAIQPEDSEISSQRGEWRAKIDVQANTRRVTEKTEYVMETIENNLTTPDNIT